MDILFVVLKMRSVSLMILISSPIILQASLVSADSLCIKCEQLRMSMSVMGCVWEAELTCSP